MPGIVPDVSAGGLPVSSATVTNAVVPAAPFTVSCTALGLPNTCDGRILPKQINAIVSEMMALAACFTPAGSWACSNLNNMCTAFTSWATGTGPGTLQAQALSAIGFKNCAGVAHAANATIPSCTEMTAAIGTAVSPAVIAGTAANNTANFIRVNDAFGVLQGYLFPA
jgi:hypothetical protein